MYGRPCIIVTILVFPFLADQIFYRFYVNLQHFRSRLFICLSLNGKLEPVKYVKVIVLLRYLKKMMLHSTGI